ncbi:MAG: glycosyl transferase family 6 [Lachnospiraceae bacterium]|nr:glycosyl transferase family 6 [Lachnospiraceae bacterium]
MKDIAIVYICTGKYDVFWKDFYLSFEEKFIPSRTKDYFVFTDSTSLYGAEQENVHVIYQENLGWPRNTLYRFRIFLAQEEELKKYEYVFFMNANVLCVDSIGEEFLPEKEGLLFVKHPGQYNKKKRDVTYERNPLSAAYIPVGEGKHYVCGGVNGGKSRDFLQMCRVLDERIAQDEEKGIIAVWHDESHINRYCYEYKKAKILNPGYCYPEGWKLPFKAKLVVREKSKYIDVNEAKGVVETTEPEVEQETGFRIRLRYKIIAVGVIALLVVYAVVRMLMNL